jgi:hypothetical protein
MYDPYTGRFMQEDPTGFDAGDVNLYRYVGNDPTNATDPSGLQERPPAYGTRAFWETQPRPALDISGTRDTDRVRQAIASLDTNFALTRIPALTPNAAAPAFVQIAPDSSIPRSHARNWVPFIRSNNLARINIRVNLINLKQGLVDGIYNMVMNNNPQGMPIDRDAVAAMANRTADDLIRMTDLFLRTHPGATSALGMRNAVGNFLGLQDRFSHPWCADWAEALDAWIGVSVRSPNHPASQFIELGWGQCNITGQHNFIVIMPARYQPQMSRPGNAAVDPVILLFDPWRDLMPRLYRPVPLTEGGYTAPTNMQNPNAVEQYYRPNLSNPRFSQPELGLPVQR